MFKYIYKIQKFLCNNSKKFTHGAIPNLLISDKTLFFYWKRMVNYL